ncbi:hypothetical protein FQA39_LY05520 [Lamprigera yunnana]|nr:hypothetical protein FQA39_LY05520 [Lamprigera yunnana]
MNEPEVEVDMEELEACLYGQIHHFATVNENLSITNEVHATSIRSCARYFEQHKPHYVSPISDGVGSDPLTKINPPANSIVVVPPPVPQVFRQPNKSSRMWLETLLTDVDKIARRREKRRRNRQKKRNRIMPFRGIGTEYFVKLPYVSSTAVKEQVILKQDVKPKEEMYEALSDTSDVVTMDTSPEVISICDDNEDLESVSEDEFNINSPEPIVDESKKPACEGASSTSSTIDYTENFQDHNREELLKELNPHSNNMFSELNLDTFADYMEGGEKTSNINILSKSPFENKQKRRISEAAINSSDSSSESEYDVEQSNESDNDNVAKDLSDTAVVPRRTSENVDTVTDKSEDLLAKRIKLDDDQNERAISDESVLLIDTSSIGYISNDDVIVIDDNESVSSVEFVMSIKPPSLQTRQRLNAEDKHFSSQKQKDQKLSTSPKGKDGKCSLPVREKNGKSLYLIGKVRNLPPAQKRKKGNSFSPKGDHGKSFFPPKETSRKSLPPNSREGKSFSPKGNCGKAFSAKGNDGKSSIPPKDKGGKSSFSAGEKYGKNFPVKDNVEKSLSPRKRDGKSFAPKGNCEKSSFSAKEKDGKSSNLLKKKDGASSFLTKGKDGKSVPPKEKEGCSSFPSIEKSQISFPLENKDEKSLPSKEKNTKPFSPKGSYEKSSFSANEKNGKSSIPPKEKIGECSFPAKELGEKSSFLPMGDGKNSFQSKEIDGKCSLPTNEREGKSCISKRKDDKLPIAQKTNRTSSLPPNENQLKSETFMKYWSDDMEKFYKGSWGQENFSVIEQQRKMSGKS